MTDDIQYLMLEHLKALRKDSTEMRADLGDVKARLSAQEEISGQILVLLGALEKRFDRTEDRLARIERRLDLVRYEVSGSSDFTFELDDELLDQLRERAAENGRSPEEEASFILFGKVIPQGDPAAFNQPA